jgi:hypothetical protein
MPATSGFSALPGCDGGREEDGAEGAGGESVQGAQAVFEFGRGNASNAASGFLFFMVWVQRLELVVRS